MKKVIPLFILLFVFTTQLKSQQLSISLDVFEGLSQINIPALISNESLDNVPRFFRVNISPKDVDVKLEGEIWWSKTIGGDRKKLYSFETDWFSAQNITNRNIGNGNIQIVRDDTGPDDIFDDLMNIGKPTGELDIRLRVSNRNGDSQTVSKTLKFTNPSQTISIRNPMMGGYEDFGAVLLEWERVAGASGYLVKANVKKNDESFEEALDSGTPLINNARIDKNTTRINMRRYLEREWLPGQEIVVRVSAVVDGVSGTQQLESEIVNFYISDPYAGSKNVNDPEEMLNEILIGNIKPSDLKRVTINGKPVGPQELLRLIQKLKSNPDLIVSKRFYKK